ncbi:MAG TPA: chromate transporter [Candidatus Acidoferrum sp.]
MTAPSLRSLAAVFARHGNTTFGGGSATIATLHGQIVTKHERVTQRQFDLSYAFSRLTPGTNLLAFSTAIVWLVRGWPGALLALLASSVPCSVLAILLTVVYESLARHPLALVALRGALAAAVGIVAGTAWTLIRPQIKDVNRFNIAAFSLGALLPASVPHLAPIRILLLAALIGAVLPPAKRAT